jgi:hypothetical protein
MQAAANSAMDTSITIKRVTRTIDATGHPSETWTTISTASGNLAQPSQAMMANYDYLVGERSTWLVRLPVGTNVQEADHLTVSGLSVPLEVQALLAPQSYQASLRLLASEVR